MIADLNEATEPRSLSVDLCLVGSGAAGLAIASEMAKSSLTFAIAESGGLDFEPPTQALYDVDISGLPHPGSTQGRFRVCGGSTTMWGGQALPLMPLDFEPREWVPHSGWPISFDELRPFYQRACRFLLIDGMNFDTDLFSFLRTLPPAFDASQLSYHFSKWSPQPSVRERYLPALRQSQKCTLLLHANVTQIVLNPVSGQVTQVELQSLRGLSAIIRARAFVLGVGGIETARLLLANRKQRFNGIGNEHDLVGRFFQDHPSALVGSLKAASPARAQQLLNVFHKHGLKYSVRCTATPQWERQHQTLNISMGATFVQDDPTLQHVKDIYTALRQRRLGPDFAGKLLHSVLHPAAAISPAYHFLVRGKSFAPGARMLIGLTSEQQPNPESRILLSDKLDALGVPRANVRWQLTDLTLHTMRKFAATLRQQFAQAGIGEIELEPWLLEDSPEWTSHINDQYHHIGTTRMNDSPRAGVVDRNCQVHGLPNLFIASSSVFPTSGHSNPTLTIIALCMRLADRLKQLLA
ncbi:MAG: GMC family oxidoreductase [Candidatus Sulfotelmatobacter sp.]